MTLSFHALVRCEACPAVFSVMSEKRAPVEGVAARDAAQDAGWAVRRGHRGRDLCAAHRIEAAA